MDHEAIAIAAYSIGESLSLALAETKVLDRNELVGLLEDAASSHRNATGTSGEHDRHQMAALLIERVISGVRAVSDRE